MKAIAYLLAFGHIALCSVLILYTRQSVEALGKLFQAYSLKVLCVIPAAVGVLFFAAASATAHPWVLRVIGLLAFGEAVLAYTDPRKLYRRMVDWYFGKLSDETQRFFGIVGIIFGTALLTWIL